MKEARADPHLRAAQSAQMASVEARLAEALAERLGTDPARDPYPGLLAGMAARVIRASMVFWASSGGAVPLDQLTDQAFRALADGLPETLLIAPRHPGRPRRTRKGHPDGIDTPQPAARAADAPATARCPGSAAAGSC